MRVDSSVKSEVIYSGIKIFLKAEISDKYTQMKLMSAIKYKHRKSQFFKAEGTVPFKKYIPSVTSGCKFVRMTIKLLFLQ